MERVSTAGARLRRWLRSEAAARALLALVTLAAYRAVPGFGYVFDDHLQLEANPWLRHPSGIGELFRQPLWGFLGESGGRSNYYRPLFGAANALQWRLFGGSPVGFHVVSLLLHLAVTQLAVSGARRLGATTGAAIAAAALFALHPVQAETVAWVAAQGDLLCALALLATMLALLAGRPWDRLAPLGYLAACLTKETAVPFLLVVPLALRLAASDRDGDAAKRADWRSVFLRTLLFAAAAVVHLLLRVAALGGLAPRSYGGAGPLGALRLAAGQLGHAAGAWLWPFPQRVLFSVDASEGIGWPLLGIAAAALLAGSLWRLRSQPARGLPVVWTLAALLPTLLPGTIGGSNFAERYLYLPSLGATWIVAQALSGRVAPAAAGRMGYRWRVAAGVAVLAALGCLAAVTGRRALAFRDDLALFRAAVASNPRSAIARNNLGAALHGVGRDDEAVAQLGAGIRLDPASADLWSNLGMVREGRGDVAGALVAYERARQLAPRHPESTVALARLLRRSGDSLRAAALLDELLRHGDSYEARCERALLHLDAFEPAPARAVLAPAVAAFPDRPRGWYLLAQAWAAMGDAGASERAARTAIAHGAGPGPRRLLARLALQRGDRAAARAELDALLARFPDDVEGRRWRSELERLAAPGPPHR